MRSIFTIALAVRRRYTILNIYFLLSNCILNNFFSIARENVRKTISLDIDIKKIILLSVYFLKIAMKNSTDIISQAELKNKIES